jgi:hypothetical protein
MDMKLAPVHPGEVLLEDFMKPLGLSAYRVAKDIGVEPIRILPAKTDPPLVIDSDAVLAFSLAFQKLPIGCLAELANL